jgi:hypothetical protein
MRLRTRGLPLRLLVLCTLLLAPLAALQPAPASAAVPAANAIDDTFARANQAGWGSSTNADGVQPVTWGIDGDGTAANVTSSANTGSFGYPGAINVPGIASAGSATYDGGDSLVKVAVSAVGHVSHALPRGECL